MRRDRGRHRLDYAMLTDHSRATSFPSVAGALSFGKEGEWKKSRHFVTQFQDITGNDLSQFRDTTRQVILWLAEAKKKYQWRSRN
jgi:hypothetical protein